MSGIGRLWLLVAIGCAGLFVRQASAVAAEWNPVRRHTVEIGPEAQRLVVGFRASGNNTIIRSMRRAGRDDSVRIVQAQTSEADLFSLIQRSAVSMAGSRQITPSMHVVFLEKTLYGADANDVLARLRADSAVEFADVDQRRYPHSVPDDPLFGPPVDVATTNSSARSGQWFMETPSAMTTIVKGTPTMDLSATDAISAWTITKGSTGTVIADVDTGVRFDHPDLSRAGFGGRLLPGYDFVGQDLNAATGAGLGSFLIANDGDGWDPDPSDPGDWISSTDLKNPVFPPTSCGNPHANNGPTDSSWHGTRVMGVLGALTDNSAGVAGMTWTPYLLPVRALGKCGGYDSDIVAGIEWAAGLSVSGVPDNPYPADIINLSLGGGTDSCSDPAKSPYKSILTMVTGMGVLVVVSAGNASGPVELPANCSAVVPGVIAVAGLRNVGTKVGYSSLGPEVGIAAPAGNCVNSSGECLRSIDTTYNTGLTMPMANGYTDQINPNLGTSFSAPIVSGIAALMRAVNANLTPAQLIARMESSASVFPQPPGLPQCPMVSSDGSGECACVKGQCGAGMINALSAVNAALRPIAAVTLPATVTAGTPAVFDASGSVAACNVRVTPNAPLSIVSYAWTGSTGILIQGSNTMPQVTVDPNGTSGTLTLTVMDSANAVDTAIVNFTATGGAIVASSAAPATAGASARACPAALTVTPAAPTVAEAFSPTSVGENAASTLTITFNNPNGFALTQSDFTEVVPVNLSVQTSPAPTTTCAGLSGTLSSSASSVTLAGAIIPANSSCSLTLSVKSAVAGSYDNTIAANALSTGPAGSNAASASAALTVTAPSTGGGGGALDWWDMLLVTGVILASRHLQGRPRR